MHRGTIRRYTDTISGSSLRPAVSAVSLADSALLDPIELTQILRPHSLALVLPLLLSSSFSLLFSCLGHVAFIHSRMLAFRSFLSASVSCSFRSLLPSSSRLLSLSLSLSPFHRCLLFIHSSAPLRFALDFLSLSLLFFLYFFFNSSRHDRSLHGTNGALAFPSLKSVKTRLKWLVFLI